MEEIEEGSRKNRMRRIYPTTIVSTSMVLLMIGLISLIGIHAQNLSNYIKENIVLTVIMNEDAGEQDVLKLKDEIDTRTFVKKSVYISKDTAAKTLTKALGDENFVHFLGYNPLSPSIDIYLKPVYLNSDSIAAIKTELLQNSLVKEVNFQQSFVESVNRNIRIVEVILLIFAGILLIIAISLIYVTVRLAIYSRRFLIKSMQLVGATKPFIRRPFLSIGVLNGLLAGIMAVILLIVLLFFAQREIPELVMLQDKTLFALVYAGILILGVLLSFISTFFAVNKHLRTHIDKLYH